MMTPALLVKPAVVAFYAWKTLLQGGFCWCP